MLSPAFSLDLLRTTYHIPLWKPQHTTYVSVLDPEDLVDERIPLICDSDSLPNNEAQTVKWESGKSNKYQVAVGQDLRFKKGCCVCGGCCVVTKGNCSCGRKVVRGPGQFSNENVFKLYCAASSRTDCLPTSLNRLEMGRPGWREW